MGFLKKKEMAKKGLINMDYLPIKLHYFFFFGAMGGTVPYMPVIAKGLGINATAVGIIFTVLPFCVFLSKPIFGFLTDYFRNIKAIVFILAVITTLAYISVLFIPQLNEDNFVNVELKCTSDNNLYISPLKYNASCLEQILHKNVICELQYKHCDNSQFTVITGTLSKIEYSNQDTKIKNSSECIANTDLSTIILPVNLTTDFTCSCINNDTSSVRSLNSKLSPCFCEEEAPSSVYQTYQFWIFTLLAVIAGTGATTVFCLSDAACYEVLGDKPELYGRQRLWATISWGLVTLLAGFLNDLATGTNENKDYSPGFYLMLAFVVVDLFLLIKIRLTKSNFSINICKDVGTIFSSWETVIFAIATYIIGALTGLIWNYEFWFMLDLGASQTLLGLAVAVQCLAAEVPMFFFAGWFIKTFGYFYCLAASLTAFTLRFGFYSLIVNPWLILPVELLHGLTFAIFYAAMTGYASTKASSGTEATMMGILGGLYEGLGVATGSLLGGVGFDKLGGRYTFLVAGCISLLCVPAILISRCFINGGSCKEELCSMNQKPNKRYDGKNSEQKI